MIFLVIGVSRLAGRVSSRTMGPPAWPCSCSAPAVGQVSTWEESLQSSWNRLEYDLRMDQYLFLI